MRSVHVDVWTVRLDEEPFDAADADAVLDAEERTRASRFVFDRDRRRFVRRRVALRRLLGRYCDRTPGDLQFGKGENGKPFLAFPPDTSITFSASHANELALVAVSRGCAIGIDVEWIGRTVEWYSVSRMFAVGERTRLRQLSGDELRFAGFRCWTRKEAFVKGRGDGLSLPLELFEVNVDAGEPPRLVSVAPEIDDGRHWTLTEIGVAPEYIACLASTSGGPHVQLHDGTRVLSS
jgi:4'-phosphopantetheinyl transferase